MGGSRSPQSLKVGGNEFCQLENYPHSFVPKVRLIAEFVQDALHHQTDALSAIIKIPSVEPDPSTISLTTCFQASGI